MRYKIRTLLIVTALASVIALWAKSQYTHPYGDKAPASLLSPIQTQIVPRGNGIISTRRITYSHSNYGISEFGNIRLAVANKPFSGKSSGTLLLASNAALAKGRTTDSFSHTGVGNRRFEDRITERGSQCRFGGLTFEISDCELHLLGDTFPVDEAPTLIVVNALGKIDALVELPAASGAGASPATGSGTPGPGSSEPPSTGGGDSGDLGAEDPFGDSPFN